MPARRQRGITLGMKKPQANPIESWWRQRVVDDATDAYVDWRDESRAVWDAYRRWTRASGTDVGFAFGGYLAALEREERAAEVYRDRVRVVDRVARPDLDHQLGATRPTPTRRQQQRPRP
jgi:hypothetical protein